MSRRALVQVLGTLLAGGPALANGGRSRRRSREVESRLNERMREAAEGGDLDQVRRLLEMGIDPNGEQLRDRPLALAAGRGHLAVVDALLNGGARPDACCCTCVTALHQAIGKHREVVRRLIAAGASVTVLRDARDTPLELARRSGDAEIVALIEARLAKK